MATGDVLSNVQVVTSLLYVLIADGATIASVGIQIDPIGLPARLAFAAALPAPGVDLYEQLITSSYVKETLSAATKVYARAEGSDCKIRFHTVAR